MHRLVGVHRQIAAILEPSDSSVSQVLSGIINHLPEFFTVVRSLGGIDTAVVSRQSGPLDVESETRDERLAAPVFKVQQPGVLALGVENEILIVEDLDRNK